MGAKDDIAPFVVLALEALRDELGLVDVDRIPAGVRGVLESFGVACYGRGEKHAYDGDTGRFKTQPGFPQVRPAEPEPPAGVFEEVHVRRKDSRRDD